MRLHKTLLAIGAAGALAAPAPALAAWTPPVTVDTSSQSNPIAVGAFGGGVLDGWLQPTVSLAKRSGDGFGALTPLTVADPFEKAWDYGASLDGNTIVVTVRKHKPTQRIRATFVASDGTRTGPMTISDHAHSATQPQLDVAADGTAVAAWQWHDTTGWRVQAAIRRPGQPRFDKPQTLSPPAPVHGREQVRPWIHVAAGTGGRAVLTWQIGGSADLPEAPLHVLTAGTDSTFGADQQLAGAGGLADVGLAVGPAGAVQVAYLDEHFSGHEAPASLHVSQGVAGASLSDPVVLSTGAKGTSSGPQVAAAFSQDGTATVAWAKPGPNYEDGGALEVFSRAPGGAFGGAQQIADAAQGVVLAGGPGDAATLAWMHSTAEPTHLDWTVHAVTRASAGGPFSPDETISSTDRSALWPSVAMTPGGDAVATWVTNTDGSGGGQVAAALHHAG
ncbi:MAG TPA: hypothetical protein VHZ31_00430 [Solirubrobacteraceae bacterium]|jgi:hypothetical protein|nr:hypothetical protein [Solirubrobacteraceae bacterium]